MKNKYTFDLDYKFKRQPFEHQMKMIKMALVEKQFALLCEMGTGKTKAMIDTYGILRKYKKIQGKCLIVCPKTIVDVWVE
jgi:hypothetical protein